MSTTVFVTGATGSQGGGVIKTLLRLDSKINIHALVRNPDSAASQSLVALSPNVKLFKGDFDNVPVIQAAASGCTAAFLNVVPVHTDPAGEVRHMKNLVEVCASTPSLKRVVLSSSGAMITPPDSKAWTEYIPNNPNAWMTHYMTSKKACEDLVAQTTSTDFPDGWSIIRGVVFFSNFLPPFSKFMYPDLETTQTITTVFRPDLELSYTDPNDVSILAATSLVSDDQHWTASFKHKRIPLGTQNLTLAQIMETMNNTLAAAGSKKQIELVYTPEHEAKQKAENGDIVADAHLFQNSHGVYLEADEVRGFGVDVDKLVGIEDFFAREKDAVIAAVGGL